MLNQEIVDLQKRVVGLGILAVREHEGADRKACLPQRGLNGSLVERRNRVVGDDGGGSSRCKDLCGQLTAAGQTPGFNQDGVGGAGFDVDGFHKAAS